MIDKVAFRIMRELPGTWIATIHDSIVTTEDEADEVQAILIDEFSKLGIKPSVSLEPFDQ
jgi:hypothetical protein